MQLSKSSKIFKIFLQFFVVFSRCMGMISNSIRKLLNRLFTKNHSSSSTPSSRRAEQKYISRPKTYQPNHVSLTAFCLLILFFTSQLIFLNPAYAVPDVCGTPGKDNPTALTNIVNTYYPGIAATASSGATSIAIGAANTGAVTPITTGDLLLVIQMQDASIDSSNSDAYGDGFAGGNASGFTSLRTAGAYQYVVATNDVPLSGGTVGLSQPLAETFTNADATSFDGQRRYQVIRVPQYASATISSTVTSFAWNGRIGGVVALDVAGDLTFSGGTIDVNGQGFRGGGGTNLGGDGSGTAANLASRNSAFVHPAPLVTGIGSAGAPVGPNNYDGSKGEGIAGTPRYTRNGGFPPVTDVTDNLVEGYPQGSFSRGAPANAGGGGTDPNKGRNAANTGGGGGANAGAGGKGGDSWTDNNFPVKRQPFGGFGGTGVSPSVSRIFLGGGAGTGTSNNAVGSPPAQRVPSGGGGGGMVIVRSGRILGSGTINADGIQGVAPSNTDGGGGGGAGGTVLIQSVTASTPSISINARGGAGLNSGNTQHGPGGGGGGGYVAFQGFTPATNVSAGVAGFALTGGFGSTPSTDNYGALPGSPGVAESTAIPAAEVKPGALCLPILTVTKTTSTPTVVKPPSGTATATYTITTNNPVTSPATSGSAINVAISDLLPSGFTYLSTTSVTLNGGATRPVTSTPAVGSPNPTFGTFTIPPGGGVVITFDVEIAEAVALGTYQNPATATYSDPTRSASGTTTSASYDPASSTGEDVTLIPPAPKLILVKRITAINGTNINGNVDDINTTDDDITNNWPTPLSDSLRGALSQTNIRPKDEVEYTIYYLNIGFNAANNVRICDPIPANTLYVANAFNGSSPTDGGLSADLGIVLQTGTDSLNDRRFLTGINDGDRGRYYDPTIGEVTPSTGSDRCVQPDNPSSAIDTNPNGIVTVNVTDTQALTPIFPSVPNATSAGVPTSSYGFVRFRVRVK